jgi:hypothetical protein
MKKTLLWLMVIAAGCSSGDATSRPQTAAVDSPRTIVDSVFSVEAEIARFKAARHGAAARRLEGGASSRDELVRRFVAALEQRDTAALRSLVLNAGEFIDLYYPTSLYARPPYKQSPELRWFLMQENSNKGFHRLLQRYGGRPAGYAGYRCADTPNVEGDNRIWDRCTIAWALHPTPLRAFSTIIERSGRYKFMSWANDL